MNTDPNFKFAVHEAAREGNAALVESLVNANPRLPARRDDDDRLPFHWAVAYNRMPIVEFLSQADKFDIDATDASGWTPLMMASSLRDADELVQFLLDHGADPNAKNNNGQSALHFAASKSHLSTAHLLLALPLPYSTDISNPSNTTTSSMQQPTTTTTAVAAAAPTRTPATTRARDRRHQYPLHRAAAAGSVPMLKLLLAHNSPLDTPDVDGLTPFLHAVSEGHGDAAVELLRRGAKAGLGAGPSGRAGGVEGAKEKERGPMDREGRGWREMVPDEKVKRYILQSAEREGIELESEDGER